MQPRSKWWIITIVLLFVFSFLYAFQPLRLKPAERVVEAVFRYTWSKPLVETEAQLPAKAAEIQTYLTDKGLKLERVEFKELNVLEIETLALDAAQETSDRSRLLSELQQKYPGVTAMALPDEETTTKPIATFWQFALYKPVPQVRL
ncbi:MAG: hypothetical protein ABFD96_15195, partial [Armatimonadia bacterium]